MFDHLWPTGSVEAERADCLFQANAQRWWVDKIRLCCHAQSTSTEFTRYEHSPLVFFMNELNMPLTVSFKLLLQTMLVKLQPASGTHLPPYNPLLPPPAISQVLLLANPQAVSLGSAVDVSNYCM